MEASKRFTELIVWQKAHQFVLNSYKLTSRFPKEEIYGLTSQLRRAAVSIAANIAEGFGKKGKKDKVRYFNISQGSIEECKYYLILARDLGYPFEGQMEVLLEEVSKLANNYSRAIANSI
ncbi:MAG: four helix bundle protein [Cyclobacteriaceae bacterium]|nr:four helix bundle protein [Cyclobacteriaceae bacterium]